MASEKDQLDKRTKAALEKLDEALREIQELGADIPQRDPSEIICSICTNVPSDVQFMIGGPGIFLCDQCIDRLANALQEMRSEAKAI
jgi:ClpX C4-type zinc finger protein